jgi:hypothetical protein
MRASNGLPVSKVQSPSRFMPNNPHEARDAFKNDNFPLIEEDQDAKRKFDFDMFQKSQNKFMGGPFKAAYFNENGSKPVFETQHAKTSRSSNQSQTRLRTTGDSFLNKQNNFTTFLSEKEDLPRLSILQNYD